MNEAKTPSLILAASPLERIRLPDSFFEENGPYYELLKNPSYLRYSGWNLRTLDTPRLKRGDYWEVTNGERKLLRLYSDGSFVAAASADQDFLGWRQEEKPAVLHALAAIEFVYEFVDFYKVFLTKAVEAGMGISGCRFKVGMKDLQTIPEKLKLRPHELDTYGFILGGSGSKYEVEGDFLQEAASGVS